MCVLNFRDIKIRILCCLNNEKKEKKISSKILLKIINNLNVKAKISMK